MPQGQATSREEAERIIREYQSSGLTRQKFCIDHNIKVGTFHWWMKRHKDTLKAKPSTFVQVTPMIKPVTTNGESDLTIDLPSGARLKWRGTILPAPLCALLEALGRGTVR